MNCFEYFKHKIYFHPKLTNIDAFEQKYISYKPTHYYLFFSDKGKFLASCKLKEFKFSPKFTCFLLPHTLYPKVAITSIFQAQAAIIILCSTDRSQTATPPLPS